MSDQMEAPPVSESQDPQAQDQAQSTQSSVVGEAVASSAAAEGVEASGTSEMTVASPDPAEAPPPGSKPAGEVENSAAAEGAEAKTDVADTAEGEGNGSKRKRRRKRKRKGDEDGVAGETPSEESTDSQTKSKGKAKPKKDPSNAPFAALFGGAAGKRHAFSTGEVVAGRVLALKDGTITVDLFGKAIAFVDEHEPRDVPPVLEAGPAESVAEVVAAEASAAETPPAETPTAETTSTETVATAESDTAQASIDAASPEMPEPESQSVATDTTANIEPKVADEPVAAPVNIASREAVSAAVVADTAGAEEEGRASAGVATEEASTKFEGSKSATVENSTEENSAAEEPKGPLAPAPVVPESFPRLEPPALGTVFKGRVGSVSESGHIVLVNRNIVKPEVRATVATFREQRRRVEGLVYGYNRGGFDVLVQGVRAFCPASAMSLHDLRNPDEFLGRKFEFLLPASKTGKDVVVSRRSILEREARKRAKELLRSLTAGQEIEGTVSSVRDFGLFVDIGGIEGLVHQSELDHGFGVKPSDVAKAGDLVKVKVLRVGAEGQKKGDKKDRVTRVSLSLKALQDDPWDSHAEAIAEGSVREGKVTRTTDFGAFIELAPRIEGLLHISELGRELKHASEAISEGATLVVIVERTDRKAHRISLSKLTDADVELFRAGTLVTDGGPKNMRPGAKINVVIEKADNRGIQVKVAGVIGRRSRGFIPGSETGTDRGSDLRKRFPAGQELEVKVIGNDRDGGLKCSIKALAVDEERKAVKDYRREASKQGFGTFGDLLKAKLGG